MTGSCAVYRVHQRGHPDLAARVDVVVMAAIAARRKSAEHSSTLNTMHFTAFYV